MISKFRLKKLLIVDLNVFAIVSSSFLLVSGCNSEQRFLANMDQQITQSINKKDYSLSMPINKKIIDLKNKITMDFIKRPLEVKFQKAFSIKKFIFNGFLNDKNEKLSDDYLIQGLTFNVRIAYDYGKIKNQTANLKVNIEISEQEIVNKINNNIYEVEISQGLKLAEVKDVVINNIFETLNSDFQNIFNKSLLIIEKIEDREGIQLKNVNFEVSGNIELAKMYYRYGSLSTQQNVKLTLKISSNENQIINYFKEKLTNIEVVHKTLVDDLKTKIIDYLFEDSELKINKSFFKIEKITKASDGQQLQDNDLDVGFNSERNFNITVSYNYQYKYSDHELIRDKFNLMINLILTDKQIAEKISNITYQKNIFVPTTIEEINNLLKTKFIEEELNPVYKSAYKNDLFQITKITKTSDGQQLQDSDLVIGVVETMINYQYGDEKGQTKFVITFKLDSKKADEFIDAVGKSKYQLFYGNNRLDIATASLPIDINFEFLLVQTDLSTDDKKLLRDSAAEKLYKYISVLNKNRSLTNEDFADSNKWFTCKISYVYNKKSATTNLIIQIGKPQEKYSAPANSDEEFDSAEE